MGLFIGMVFILRPFLSIYFIAIAFSAAIFTGCCINYFHINKVLKISVTEEDIYFIGKSIAATILMAAGAFYIYKISTVYLHNLFLALLLISVFSAGIYFIILNNIFRIQELKLILNLLIPKKKYV